MQKTIHSQPPLADWSLLKRVLIAVILLLLCAISVVAQERTITGTVVDKQNKPLVGATVLVTGTIVATITDNLGVFRLKLPANAAAVDISFIGYKPQHISVKSRNAIHVEMEEDAILMDATVVIGYGTTKQGNLSGSVVKLDAAKIEGRNVDNIASALQGMLAGVEVRTNSGAPGEPVTLRVRGSASVNAESDPLYVIDGVPVDDLSNLNSSDVQSIEVLKDASSAAIYGSRGANGVFLITTKMPGKGEATKVELAVSYGIQQLERKADVLNAQEWIDFRTNYNNALYVEQYGSRGATAKDDYITRMQYTGSMKPNYVNDPRWAMPGYGGLAIIDWQDAFFRSALKQDYRLSISGSHSKTSYRISVGYMDQNGIAVESGQKKLNLQAKLQTSLLNDRVKLNFDIRPSITTLSGGRVDGKDNTSNKVLSMCPIAEPDAGIHSGAQPYTKYAWAGGSVSPISYMEEVTNTSEDINLASSLSLDFNIAKGLTANILGSHTYKSSESHRFIPSTVDSGWNSYGEGYKTTARRSNSRSSNYLLQAITSYNRTFDKHQVSAMAGYSMESSTGSSSALAASQFPHNSLESFNDKDQVLTSASAAFDMPVRMVSFFGRLQYIYDDRYVLMASVREDGSSRLGIDNRWGFFPAISAAYRISNESFWPKNFFINQLKLRGSWGVNGNNRISSTAALALLGSANYSGDGALINGYAPTSIDNRDLGWERTHSWNVAMDLSLLKNKVSFSVEYYDKITRDLLYQVTVPAVIGFSKTWGNIGRVSNKGVEFELSSFNINKQRFKWNTQFNVSYNKNRVESLGDNNSTIYMGYSDSNTQVLMMGQPIGAYYMYDAVGVYQYKEDLKRYPTMKGSVLGDTRYRDANDDGIINDADRTLVGSPAPDFTYGMTNTFKYKNLELSILITAQTGGMIYSVLGRSINRPGMNLGGNVLACWSNMWVSEEQPGDGRTPGITNGNTGSLYDTRWLYSTDFIKIKNVTLSYAFRPKKSSLLRSARIYISAENLYMWDKYKGGFSPETNNGNLLSAYDYGAYPQARVFTFGATVSF